MMNTILDDISAMRANLSRSDLNAIIMNYLVTGKLEPLLSYCLDNRYHLLYAFYGLLT